MKPHGPGSLAKSFLVILLCCGATHSAGAMNQEGHDDWMAELPHAAAFFEALPDARPLPSTRCPVTSEMLADNRYEQIPLPRHRCQRRGIERQASNPS